MLFLYDYKYYVMQSNNLLCSLRAILDVYGDVTHTPVEVDSSARARVVVNRVGVYIQTGEFLRDITVTSNSQIKLQ